MSQNWFRNSFVAGLPDPKEWTAYKDRHFDAYTVESDKISLRAYFHAIDKTETDECQYVYSMDAKLYAILLESRNWIEVRPRMWAGRTPSAGINQVLCDSSMVAQAAKMILRTGLLEQFRAVPSMVLTYTKRRRVHIVKQKSRSARKGLTSAQTQNGH